MTNTAPLPDVIPVFPLSAALLLPRGRLPLHIFEPRYRAMVEDALATKDRLIGMIQPLPMPGRSDKGLHKIGCAGRITQMSETEDGRYLITLGGVSRFRVTQEVETLTPYRRCAVDWAGFERDRGPAEEDAGFAREPFMRLLDRHFSANNLSVDWPTLTEAEDELLINSLAMLLDFPPEEKQALLEAPTLSTRRETMVALLEYGLTSPEGERRMQ